MHIAFVLTGQIVLVRKRLKIFTLVSDGDGRGGINIQNLNGFILVAFETDIEFGFDMRTCIDCYDKKGHEEKGFIFFIDEHLSVVIV